MVYPGQEIVYLIEEGLLAFVDPVLLHFVHDIVRPVEVEGRDRLVDGLVAFPQHVRSEQLLFGVILFGHCIINCLHDLAVLGQEAGSLLQNFLGPQGISALLEIGGVAGEVICPGQAGRGLQGMDANRVVLIILFLDIRLDCLLVDGSVLHEFGKDLLVSVRAAAGRDAGRDVYGLAGNKALQEVGEVAVLFDGFVCLVFYGRNDLALRQEFPYGALEDVRVDGFRNIG